MKRKLDLVDVLVASGLAASIVLWAFVWAEPYPHPDMWPFLAKYGWHIPLTALSVFGKLGLGVFAGLVYLIIRGAWLRFRPPEDELPDRFFFTRFCPLCGAAAFALFSSAWRAGQYLSPDFALLVLAALGLFLWQRGCGYIHMSLTCAAYLLLAFVAGVHPLGLVALVYVTASDILRRWRSQQYHGQRKDDMKAELRRLNEMKLSLVAGLFGFGISVYLTATRLPCESAAEAVVALVLSWWRDWLGMTHDVFGSFHVLALVAGVGFAAASLSLGRRLRAHGEHSFGLAVTLSSVLALVAVAFALRAVDSDERMRLALMRDYVRAVLADSEGADWLFTDGRFDEILRFEVRRRGMKLRVLNALLPPSKEEAAYLRTLAPEPGEADIFAAGGSEVFKAWARERPDRLAASAWQLGSSTVRRFAKVVPRTNGSVIRGGDGKANAWSEEADRRFAKMARDVLATLAKRRPEVAFFGSVDDAVAQSFDALAWRAARMAGERAEAASKKGDAAAAEAERTAMKSLDAMNGTLRAQGSVIERLLPTANLVLTSREALEVALKRADFMLAQRYAREVLVSAPDDARAHFALGMANLEAGEHFNATRHFERVLQTLPNEPATLNNLSLAYFKLGRVEEAQAAAEKALKANPDSAEVKKNLEAIRKKVGK